MSPIKLILTLLVYLRTSSSLQFPKDFKFGVATASYQIEGGWNSSGKGENIWDRLTHEHPDWIKDRANGDIACDSYNLWKQDVKMLKYLGVDYYRFSLSWSRILPSGYSNYINPDGVRYYNNLINELLENNIKPVVTLYHWDLPQPLQDIGGWPNLILANYFEDYARIAFKLFGDRVKAWITFNEPPMICESGYSDGDMAPAYKSRGIADYMCGKTLLLAHAKAYRIYDNYFRAIQGGIVGITIDTIWAEPKTNHPKDVTASERWLQMNLGWWAHPIFSKTGDYPEIMKTRIANISKAENFSTSRLPAFTNEEVHFIQGTYDFFGLNHYSSWLVSDIKLPMYFPVSHWKDVSVLQEQDPSWKSSAAPWLKVVPWGFRKLLNWIRREYNNPPLIVTENGFADLGGLNDTGRIEYLKEYLKELLKAIVLDGCNVKGYTHWSLMDNMEWRDGYTFKFGLYNVNFNDTNRTRTRKASVDVYRTIIKTRTIPEDDVCVEVNLLY